MSLGVGCAQQRQRCKREPNSALITVSPPPPPVACPAVITGVQVHNWAFDFEDDSPHLEFVVSAAAGLGTLRLRRIC